MLNKAITGQAAVVAIVNQFKVLMPVMSVVSPLVLFLRKPSPATWLSRRLTTNRE